MNGKQIICPIEHKSRYWCTESAFHSEIVLKSYHRFRKQVKLTPVKTKGQQIVTDDYKDILLKYFIDCYVIGFT